jgi:hypothetical protein
MDRSHLPQKWHAAGFGTLLPFFFAIYSYPSTWLKRWSFWTSLAICLTIHTVVIWIFFQYVLADVYHLGWALWFPVAVLESVALLIAIKKIEDKLTGKREAVKLWS